LAKSQQVKQQGRGEEGPPWEGPGTGEEGPPWDGPGTGDRREYSIARI
jgi:hypothetical protein